MRTAGGRTFCVAVGTALDVISSCLLKPPQYLRKMTITGGRQPPILATSVSTGGVHGQTDRIDAQVRQSRFQNVFLDNETPRADGVDLLSVTTTMEAGVDIGALSAVMLEHAADTLQLPTAGWPCW